MTVPVEPAPLMLEVPVSNRGVVAVDDDGAAAAHGNVTGEISGGALLKSARWWRCPPLSGQKWCYGAVAGDNHAGGAVGHTDPGERVDGLYRRNNHAGAIPAADIHAAIGVMRPGRR